MDWYSRYVLAWRLFNSLETHFCVEALEQALASTASEIFNTDQGVQFTSVEFTRRLDQRGIRISMDGRGRALDNAFVERLWPSGARCNGSNCLACQGAGAYCQGVC